MYGFLLKEKERSKLPSIIILERQNTSQKLQSTLQRNQLTQTDKRSKECDLCETCSTTENALPDLIPNLDFYKAQYLQSNV